MFQYKAASRVLTLAAAVLLKIFVSRMNHSVTGYDVDTASATLRLTLTADEWRAAWVSLNFPLVTIAHLCGSVFSSFIYCYMDSCPSERIELISQIL